MGTNYYLYQKPPCECCKRPYEPLHIGKSSAGWCFALHVIPEQNINSLNDWRKLWNQSDSYIENEYGEKVSIAELENIITNRFRERNWNSRWFGSHYTNEESFHNLNHSQRGPNGLLRAKIGKYCVGHGQGTWDLVQGEFS